MCSCRCVHIEYLRHPDDGTTKISRRSDDVNGCSYQNQWYRFDYHVLLGRFRLMAHSRFLVNSREL